MSRATHADTRTRPSLVHRAAVITTARASRLGAFRLRWATTFLGHIQPQVHLGLPSGDPAASCLDAHLDALTSAAEADPHEALLVVEDDACFTPRFPWVSAPPPDWDVLWLGAQHLAAPRPVRSSGGGFFLPGWVRPVEIMRTHGYVAREPGRVAELLRRATDRQSQRRPDPYLARLTLTQYVAEPQTVGQIAGTSDTGGASSDHDRFWHLAR